MQKYGSCDGGVTVHADLPELNDKMRAVAEYVNVKGHWVGTNICSFKYSLQKAEQMANSFLAQEILKVTWAEMEDIMSAILQEFVSCY